MSMRYKVGDRVRIVRSKTQGGRSWNTGGRMDKYLGQVMTIRDVIPPRYKMEEDIKDTNCNSTPGWDWEESMIEGLVEEDIELNDPGEDTVLNKFLCEYQK